MSNFDAIGSRMKANYEGRSRTFLTRRTPVAIRIDGKSFHTYTKGFKKPFDEVFLDAMRKTMKSLCEEIQGCVFGYTQSDEITLILIDYQNLNTDAWFDYQVQKMCSVAASYATYYFNKYIKENIDNVKFPPDSGYTYEEMKEYYDNLEVIKNKMAVFDARCFNIPKEEVLNLLYWRQLDCARNSILSCGQHYIKSLYKLKCDDIIRILKEEYNFDWNELPSAHKYGTTCYREGNWAFDIISGCYNHGSNWILDTNIQFGNKEASKLVNNAILYYEE